MTSSTRNGPIADGSNAAESKPDDQAERTRVSAEVGATMFVEAGAGTGKTRALVERVLALINGPDPVPVENLAAITFTEKAAAELRNRIRAAIGAKLADNPEGASADLLRDALDGLDAAAISTLHGFARRILAEHAIEAGLPPKFEALDQIASDVDFAERWDRFTDELFDDPAARWAIEVLDAAGVNLTHLNEVGVAFNSNWDRIRCANQVPQAAGVNADAVVAAGRALAGRARECSAHDDKALARFGQLSEFVDRLAAASHDAARIAVLTDAEDSAVGVPKIGNVGSKGNWHNLASVRSDFVELRELCNEIAATALNDAIALMCDRIARFTLDSAAQRHAAGRLEFHDLLVRARDLLRQSPSARASLHRHYRQILLDESQDTDPIQIEIAALIAGESDADADGGEAREGPEQWSDVNVEDGRLFFVGDPKQSIYRFRRADIGLYLQARERFGGQVGSMAKLDVNFRSAAPIIDWVNAVFANLIGAESTGEDAGLQPGYRALKWWREALQPGPSVVMLGQTPYTTTRQGGGHTAATIRETEAADIASVIGETMAEGWAVYDPHTDEQRPATLADIAILVPTRTGLPQLEQGLSDAEIPYRLEASEFVWRSRTVRDLMMCLRAVADPDNELAVVSALRTPIYGCGDDDLYSYYQAVRSWSYFATDLSGLSDGSDHPVARGLAHMRALYEQHTGVSPATLLDRIVRDCRLLEQAAVGSPQREVWRHVRYVIDQARAWSESQRGGLRGFLRWAETQASDGAKVTEAILPESDDDSVRVLTIHAAKGLEFPIVILAGLSGGNRARPESVQVGFGDSGWEKNNPADKGSSRWSGAAAVRFRSGVETGGYELWRNRERRAEHFERIRLLYVGCTRARDHLVVSLHRPEPSERALEAGNEHLRTSAQIIADALPVAAGSKRGVWDFRDEPADPPPSLALEPAAPSAHNLPADRGAWLERRDRAATATQIRSSISASRIARHNHPQDQPISQPLPAKDADLDGAQGGSGGIDGGAEGAEGDFGGRQRPERRGRGGTAVGSAVHGVLQAIDLGSGAGLERLVEAQANAVNVPRGRHAEIRRFVQSALASDEVDQALRGRFWRELYAAAPLGDANEPGALVEGLIDLLYESGDSGDLVVVDFKTDALGVMPDQDHAASGRAEAYRTQVAAYAWSIERSTGRRVGRAVLLYLRSDGTPAVPDVLEGHALRQAIEAVPQQALAATAQTEAAGSPR